MKAIAVLRKIAALLLNLGVITIILTIVQPMPAADTIFRIGAGIAIVVSIGLLIGLDAIEKKHRSNHKE